MVQGVRIENIDFEKLDHSLKVNDNDFSREEGILGHQQEEDDTV